MAKDYRKPQKAPPSPRFFSRFLFLLIVFFSGYVAATLFDWKTVQTLISKVFNRQALHRAEADPVAAKHSPQKPPVARPKYEFYTLLSKESKPVSALPLQARPPEIKAAYHVQIAAFNQRAEAERLRATLVLRGFDVRLEPFLKDKMTWYRVVAGPFNKQTDAEKARIFVAQHYKIQGMLRKG